MRFYTHKRFVCVQILSLHANFQYYKNAKLKGKFYADFRLSENG